jgi:ribose 5-phosphate isomerase
MELLECKNKIKELVNAMVMGVGTESTTEFLILLIAALNKHKADEQ